MIKIEAILHEGYIELRNQHQVHYISNELLWMIATTTVETCEEHLAWWNTLRALIPYKEKKDAI